MRGPAMAFPILSYFLAAALVLLVFLRRFSDDQRRFGNGVLLGLCTVFLLAGTFVGLDHFLRPLARVMATGLIAGATVGAVVVAGFLLTNGIRMIRTEGGSLANLLPLLAGVAVLVALGLLGAAARFENGPLRAVATATLFLAGYLSFLFACFIGYAVLYQRVAGRRPVDFVVVLGAGLTDGSVVPPLLASRLERALTLYRRQKARGRSPILLVSGGKGSDEQVPEAEAMADYLTGRGVPDEHVVRENSSTSTEENLKFSRELMERLRPGYRCVIVTNDFHAFRAAVLARRAGVPGEATGSPTAAYYWPSATLREFVAVLVAHRVTNLGMGTLLLVAGARAGWHG
ncbi:YdcF family protein [Streptomyces sp. NPDC001691]|uniref:YdcF family protein n=1 Tax=Streptomyces sp. NPDC001691 TaxID=3364600 RepID=UPI003688D10B